MSPEHSMQHYLKKENSRTKTNCKAAGPSRITAEMLKATGPEGVERLRQLGERIFNGDAIPKDWEESIILYKGKRDALDRGNYRGLKLTEHPMKCLERVLDCHTHHGKH